MITTKLVLKDKFWILQEDGVSVGHLRNEGTYISAVVNKEHLQFASLEEANEKLNIGVNEKHSDLTVSQLQHVYGYQTDLEQVFHVHEDGGLPCYAKAKNSKVIHAAGWYGMHRNGAYAEAFCPKVNTLRTYPFIGPFKNQTDLRVAMISWKRNDQTRPITAGQVLG
jgi:hypothetical protein